MRYERTKTWTYYRGKIVGRKVDNMNKIFKVFTLKLARELGLRGFKPIAIEPNRKAPWLNVYLFENSEELQKLITEINN